jgi:hypothetical protein
MGSIDGEKYPDLTAREAAEIADILVNTFGGEPSSPNAFAQEVGHKSADSGAFKMKIANVRRYGLLPGRGLEPTELAYTVADPRDDEAEQEAMFQMYRNITILNQLYDQLDGQTPGEEFWRILTEITSAEPKDAKQSASYLERLYTQMLRREPDKDSTQNSQTSDDMEILEEASSRSSTSAAPENGILIQVSGDQLTLNRVNEANLEVARLFVESKKRELSTTSVETTEEDQSAELNQFID